jgi:hypothetical protein
LPLRTAKSHAGDPAVGFFLSLPKIDTIVKSTGARSLTKEGICSSIDIRLQHANGVQPVRTHCIAHRSHATKGDKHAETAQKQERDQDAAHHETKAERKTGKKGIKR